jgi:hypothetical protein
LFPNFSFDKAWLRIPDELLEVHREGVVVMPSVAKAQVPEEIPGHRHLCVFPEVTLQIRNRGVQGLSLCAQGEIVHVD